MGAALGTVDTMTAKLGGTSRKQSGFAEPRPAARLRIWATVAAMALSACGTPRPVPPAPVERTIAVPPFRVLGQDEGADHLGRAFAASLTAVLGQVDHLAMAETPDAATHVLEGTLTRKGEEVRATARLLGTANANEDGTVWELGADSDGDSLSTLASRLAARVVDALGLEPPRLYRYIGDLDLAPEIAASPLTAQLEDARRRNDIPELVRASVELTERYADAPAPHVLNAWALTQLWDADPSGENLSRLKDRLVALDRVDPRSPYDELMRAYIYRSSGNPEQARALYSEVLARSDLSTTARSWALRQRSLASLQVGDAEAARRDAEQAATLDPSNAQNLVALSKAQEALLSLDAAAEASLLALALEPHQWRHHQRLGLVYLRAERYDEAATAIGRACDLGESQEACANLAVALTLGGRDAEARAAAKRAASLTATPWGQYNLACYRALAGDGPGALEDLRRTVDLGFADTLITTDSDLASLRGDRRLEALVAEVEDRLRARRALSDSVFPWQG